MTIRCILFDLGGVLVRFRGVERLAAWLGDDEVREAHWRRWLGSGSLRLFETGRMSPEEFIEDFLAELRPGLGRAELMRELEEFVGGPLPGAVELLDELRPHYLVACLSNTNALHWPRAAADLELDRRLHRAFLSFETGVLKPDPEAFERVCRDLDMAAAEILFFDDAPPNVEAAAALGFRAVQARSPADCRRELERLGLLPVAP